MSEQEQVQAILSEHGATLVRSKKHLVYRFPDGKVFVASSTPSDSYRHYKNQLRDLHRILGLYDPDRAQPGERREHRTRAEAAPQESAQTCSQRRRAPPCKG